MMNYNEFQNAVAAQIVAFLPDELKDADIIIQNVTKANDMELVGLIIRGENKVAPCIYLEKFYDDYEEGKDMDDILEDIVDVRIRSEFAEDFDINDITNLNKVRDKIFIRLRNTKTNEEYLANKPHKDFLDLSASYIICFPDNAIVPITDSILNEYGITIDELHTIALENTRKDIEFKSMREIIIEMMGIYPEEEIPSEDEAPMYVLSNSRKTEGAGAILDKTIMDEIREQLGHDLIIIPSSIHEVIIINADMTAMSPEDLSHMIDSVNANELEEGDILSNHPYIYTKANGLNII